MSKTSEETSRITLERLFFSRTDEQGVIRGANSVFAYVSDYEMTTMLGAPHRLVRHDDMPRGVFHLMWDRLRQRLPFGAYVKNLAQDGTHYWVFAVVGPTDGGYLSVRLKPTSDLLGAVQTLYEGLRKEEHGNKTHPAQSAAALLAALQRLGHVDYDAFMSAALRAEYSARADVLGRPRVKSLEDLARLASLTSMIAEQARKVETVFRSTDQIPYNMRLQASRMEGSDGPISVISENHRQMCFAVEGELKRFKINAASGAQSIALAEFLNVSSALMDEMAEQFACEEAPAGVDVMKEQTLLERLGRSYGSRASSSLVRFNGEAMKLGRQCREIRRVVAGLEMTRIMCKIERGRAKGDPEGLDEIVARLVTAEERLTKALSQIETAVQDALEVSETLTDLRVPA
ncbi:MAG: hypothetical protein AAFY38_01020 [Pseudomonadota bacterium]